MVNLIDGFDWKDKLYLSDVKICPPHRIPHKIPLGRKITNECCHVHTKKRGMIHHRPFCKILKCKHYRYMVNEYRKYKRIKKVLKSKRKNRKIK